MNTIKAFFLKYKSLVITALAVILGLGFLLVLIYVREVSKPLSLSDNITFELRPGWGAGSVGDALAQEGLISQPWVFKTYVFLSGKANSLQAGTYDISAGMTIKDLVGLFQVGLDDIKLTFIEGMRLEEYALYVSEILHGVSYDEFVVSAKKQNLEGHLFPDTYFVKKDITSEELITLLRSTFESKTANLLTQENLEKVNLTREEAVVLASIVEREVRSLEDRKVVAGILEQRLLDGVALQADATVQYAISGANIPCASAVGQACPPYLYAKDIDWWPLTLSQTDLEFESAFNTRKYAGLPPGPISSFSLTALEAVLFPTRTDFYYYLTDSEGITRYAETYDEHLENISLYLN